MAINDASGLFLVTGARLGIGRAVSEALLAVGHSVLGVSRTICAQPIEHPRFTGMDMDLSNIAQLADEAKRLNAFAHRAGGFVGAVFCAGAGTFGFLEQLSTSQIKQQIDLNLTSQIVLTKQLIGLFKQQKRGLLIYMGSEAALNGGRQGTIYCASKFGLRGFVQALNEECGVSGVRATIINPGMVRTPFFDGLNFRPGEDAMNAIAPATIGELVAHLARMPPATVVDEITLSPRKKVLLKTNPPVE